MPTIRVKPLSEIEANYKGSASEAQRRYVQAIPRMVWQENAIAGQDLYVSRMSDPAVLARREEKIREVSDSEFREAVQEKGANILASRMGAASSKMAQGYAPIRQALEGLSIPERTADPMANIDNRLKPVVDAMRRAAGK